MNRSALVSSLLIAALGGTAFAGGGNKRTTAKEEVHKVGPVTSIHDDWTPTKNSSVLKIIAIDPAAADHLPTASAVVDKDGTWAFSGKWVGNPCFLYKMMDPEGKCRLQIVMGLKSDKGTWFYFQEDSGEIKGGEKSDVTWEKQGRSKVIADNFKDFSSKGHSWTIAVRVLWKEVEPPSKSLWDDISSVVSDVGDALKVAGPFLAALA